jgi:hypothetical protein
MGQRIPETARASPACVSKSSFELKPVMLEFSLQAALETKNMLKHELQRPVANGTKAEVLECGTKRRFGFGFSIG